MIMGLLFLVSGGCGLKAPPVPPEEKPPVIKELVHTINNGTLTLAWDLADDSPPPQAYTLYQSKVPVSDETCEGCPLVFERLLNIPATMQRNGAQTLTLEKGFRYGFKVTATIESGRVGPDSNTVRFNYK
jgi:hypothetical protein